MPLNPEPIVPSQNASMSASGMPADDSAPVADSTSRSSTPLPQCSPNSVHAMPTTATRSRMPRDAMSDLLAGSRRASLPAVVVNAVGRAQPAERHDHAVADRQRVGVDVSDLTAVAAAAVEVDDRGDNRRAR